MTAILDASALIYLGKADLLSLAAKVCEGLAITTGVYDEAVTDGQNAGHRDATKIARAVRDGSVKVTPLAPSAHQLLMEAAFPSALGPGEKETIVEAAAQQCLAVLDDTRARAAAVVLGVEFCRTETLLVEALVTGLISLTEFETGLLRLAQARNMRASELAELLRLGRVIGEGLRNDRAST
jgi:predicted nucleic acid-binding protein